jgi:hypothetical protein
MPPRGLVNTLPLPLSRPRIVLSSDQGPATRYVMSSTTSFGKPLMIVYA